MYAYVAVQRPPVVTGHTVSLTSFASCLAGMRGALDSQAGEWKTKRVSLNDGGRTSGLYLITRSTHHSLSSVVYDDSGAFLSLCMCRSPV